MGEVIFTWPDVLSRLIAGSDLTAEQTGWAMREILSGAATPSQIAGFAVALRAKGETIDEVEGLVATMYEFATPLRYDGRAVDIVGTGGDRSHTVNISTMAALVTAGADVPVVKHGNRAASSSCGSADVLEGLGIPLDLSPERVEEIARKTGLTFCFAPVFHSALRHSAVPRRELGVATTFNFLGPLANPSRPAAQAVGVADLRLAGIIAGVLARRGVDGFVFRGNDGLDELTTTTTSQIWSIVEGVVTEQELDPAALGIDRAAPVDLRGGDVTFNAAVVRRLLDGEPGPVRDAVLLNAAAGIAAYDVEDAPLLDRLRSGLAQAERAVDSGAAKAKLSRWVSVAASVD
ncbi:MAG: anthranilate phosphoribosyltransferase [Propionibacteriales bacterium]|nr:anthranilate phosphoribosyltransferase [Propionibacteriales bacterium]